MLKTNNNSNKLIEFINKISEIIKNLLKSNKTSNINNKKIDKEFFLNESENNPYLPKLLNLISVLENNKEKLTNTNTDKNQNKTNVELSKIQQETGNVNGK